MDKDTQDAAEHQKQLEEQEQQGDLCSSCPECGCGETDPDFNDVLGKHYRVCMDCEQEWYTDIDYFNKVSSTNA